MKKAIALFILILSLITVMLPVQAADFDLVNDEVGLLTENEYFELNELAQDITDRYECEVSIVIIDDMDGNDAKELAKSIYNEYGYGYGEDRSGLMLLLSTEDRQYAIIAYGYGNTAFTDYGRGVLEDRYLLPLLGENEYYDAFSTYLNQTSEYLDMAENGSPFDVDTDEGGGMSNLIKIAIVIFIPLLIAGIVCGVFYQQMKTAKLQAAADNYVSDGGVKLTMKEDRYLFRTETRTKIEKDSGGTSIDSDGFSGSSGEY